MELANALNPFGYGYGDGSGYGYGYGYGSGYGYGYGYGYGSGSGSGSGYGDGYGYGSGYGYGYGLVKYYVDLLLAPYAQQGTVTAFWRSNMDGTPANGGTGVARKEGDTETIEGPLSICTKKALHGTLDPRKWKGERWWVVALHEPVERSDDKIASLTRTILKDLGKCPF